MVFDMMHRYRAIGDKLDWTDPELINFISAPSENALINELVNKMAKFNSVSKKLQDDRISIHDIRLFSTAFELLPGTGTLSRLRRRITDILSLFRDRHIETNRGPVLDTVSNQGYFMFYICS